MKHFLISISIVILLFFLQIASAQKSVSDNYLISFFDSAKNAYGYKNVIGAVVIESGKYKMCFTDTFRTYAIVLKEGDGFVAIDRQQSVLYQVFPFDNGPDYYAEGLFRIVLNGKIGYADSATGKVVIKPQFKCAYPFEHGVAKVSINCNNTSMGEYHYWVSKNWNYIDKKGNKINKK